MRRFTTTLVLAGFAAAAMAGSASAATASSAWLANPSLGTPLPGAAEESFLQKVGPDGTTNLVWVNENDDLRMVRILPNGRYGTPVTVNLLPNDTSAGGFDFALDKNGAGVIAWKDTTVAGSTVKVRRFDKKGKLAATATTVTTGTPTNVGSPSVAIDSYGFVTVVWHQGTPSRVLAVRLALNNSVRKSITELCESDSTKCDSPHVVVTGAGVSTIIWQEQLNGSSDVKIRTNQIDAGDRVVYIFGPSCSSTPCSKVLYATSQGSYEGVGLEQSSGGGSFAAWVVNNAGSKAVYARRIETNGTPDTTGTQAIRADSTDVISAPSLSVNSVGSAIITWVDGIGAPCSSQLNCPTVWYRRIASTGSMATAKYADKAAGITRSDVQLASTGAATLAWAKGSGEISWLNAPKTDSLGIVNTISGNKATGNSQGPALARGKDGTVIATWLNGSDAARRFVSQVNATAPTLSTLKFPSRFKSRQRSGQVKINSSKFGTAVVTIAPATRATKFRTRVTRIAVPSGSTTLKFNTSGLIRGKYTVSVQLVDYAGLKVTKTAKLLVTS